jgi:Icc-related predicted phosphoesterase
MRPEIRHPRPQRLTRVLCAADVRGSGEAVDALLRAAAEHDVQVLALVGDISGGGEDRSGEYRSVFRALGRSELDTYWVPGPSDAPVEDYLREAHNIEVVFPFLHGVHGTAAFAPGTVLVAGFGGEVDDDPAGARDELRRLRYPRWEVEYRLKLIGRELSEHEQTLILLFSTPPAHKGRATAGSEALAELAVTHRARLVVCGGERGTMMLGRTLVVAPGSLADGGYAIADVHARTAELAELPLTRP